MASLELVASCSVRCSSTWPFSSPLDFVGRPIGEGGLGARPLILSRLSDLAAPSLLGPLLEAVEEFAMKLDVPGKAERMLSDQALGEIGIALLQRRDDVQMLDNGTARAIVLAHGHGAHRPHMDEEIIGELAHQAASTHADDRLVKGHVGLRILVDVLRRV